MVDKSRNFIALVRLGYAARGITYMLLGYLALATAGEAKDGAQSVFDYLEQAPLGTIILYVIALGLLAYALFKLLSAASDIQHRGSDAEGIVKRVGDAASAVAYLFLCYAAFQFASGSKSASGSGGSRKIAGSVLHWELGPIVIGAIGLGFFAAAFMQAKGAVTAGFMRHLSGHAPTGVEAIGRAGYAARAVVFALIGWSLVQSAWLTSSTKVKGLGEAILSLRDMGVVYTLVAIGLLLFGAFSLVMARYRVIPDFRKEDVTPKV
jgi:hypothetical protein